MDRSIRIMAIAALLALAGCGGDEPGRGGLTAAEERALDNAAAMLDENAIELPEEPAESPTANAQ